MRIGNLTNRDVDKAEVFKCILCLSLQLGEWVMEASSPELEIHDCKNYQFPADPEIVWDLLLQLGPYRSMGLNGTQLRS